MTSPSSATIQPARLSVADHRRDNIGMTYVYPVVSRRAGGVSVGINLNPNNACNWHCIYCQVPNLIRGGPPPIDLSLLRLELNQFLEWALNGDFMDARIPEGARQLVDIAFSGNGEPTMAHEFADAVAIAQTTLNRLSLQDRVVVRVITNGSMMDRRRVQQGIAAIGAANGEIWFKLDTFSPAGLARINGTRAAPESVLRRLKKCAGLAPTWIQTCVFELDGNAPSASETKSYLACVTKSATRSPVFICTAWRDPRCKPRQRAFAASMKPRSMRWLNAFAPRVSR